MSDLGTRLDAAIEAAGVMGIDTGGAVAARTAMTERAGFPGDLYVLALVGGTGVGKSSLLNALAGTTVAAAGIHRPTTRAALAWVPEARQHEAGPLLDWLGGAEVAVRPSGADDPLGEVAVLDLPDLDSVEASHALRVDAVLPRVDAVLWVSDPEKYADAVLHDRYLQRWLPSLGRQAFVLNKTDLLDDADAQRLAADIDRRLARTGASSMPILLASATSDTGALHAWLMDGVRAKEVVGQRLDAAASSAIGELLAQAGLETAAPPGPLVADETWTQALQATVAAVLRVVDLEGLRDQAIAATQAAARSRGGGPSGIIRTLVDRGRGSPGLQADPSGYLLRWRDRGTLVAATRPIRELVVTALATLPAGVRPSLAATSDTSTITDGLTRATDRAIAGPVGRFRIPTSRLWPPIGLAQVVATAAIAAGAIWLVVLLVSGGHVATGSLDVPLLGPVPLPAVLIIGGLFTAYLLGRLLRWHAERMGRRWAAELSAAITAEVADSIGATACTPLAAWQEARRALWAAGPGR